MINARANLERLILEQGEDFSSLSKLLGRNPAYIQQFIRRGIPRKLDEDDRRKLAQYFGVDESVLGGLPPIEVRSAVPRGRARDMVMVPMLRIGASAGPGALVGDEIPEAQIGFETRWLRKLGSNTSNLSLIQVSGDSMSPTLADGDDILVDRSDVMDRLRDGIYVLRIEDALMVKRIALNPIARVLTIKSDNPSYPEWTNCDPATVNIIGRVVWVGRKLV
jgi:SOS-response transcriptional repressor LexA